MSDANEIKDHRLELRFDDRRRLDELVATGATVHLEHLGGSWMLIVETPSARAHLEIKSSFAVVVETEGLALLLDRSGVNQ